MKFDAKYSLDKGAIIFTYDGITIGMDTPSQERLSVLSLDSTYSIIRTPTKERIELERCK